MADRNLGKQNKQNKQKKNKQKKSEFEIAIDNQTRLFEQRDQRGQIYQKDQKDQKEDNKSNCGGFVVTHSGHVLGVCTNKGAWGYPKGKRKKGELIIDCAYRELEEETGLKRDQITIVKDVCFNELTKKGVASVTLFLATLNSDSLIKPKVEDEEELAMAKWLTFEEAIPLFTVKNRASILRDAINVLKTIEISEQIAQKEIEKKE